MRKQNNTQGQCTVLTSTGLTSTGLTSTPLLVPNTGRRCSFYSPAHTKPHTRGVVPSPGRTARHRDRARATSISADRRESVPNPPHLKNPRHTFTSALTVARTFTFTFTVTHKFTLTFTFRACSPLLVPNTGRKSRFYWPAHEKPHTRGVIPTTVRTSRRRGRAPPAGATSTSTDRRESAGNNAHLEDLDEL